MTGKRSSSSVRKQPSLREDGQFNLGAEVISQLISVRQPIIMVDRILGYASSPQRQLTAERHISANEPVFVGHFPDLKLWPGVYTIEGLRQSCLLLDALTELERSGVLHDLLTLQGRATLSPRVDEASCQRALSTLRDSPPLERLPLVLRIKLLAPVFAGCVMRYRVIQDSTDVRSWSVEAVVDGKRVAKGEVQCQPECG